MKKNLLTVLILALLIVNIVLTVVMMVSVMSVNSRTASLVRNITTALNLEITEPGEEKKEQVSLKNTAYFTIEGAMTIALRPEADAAGETKQGYLMFNISFSMNTKSKDYKTYKDTIADYEMAVKDVVTSVVGAHTASECADTGMLKTEILAGVQELFGSDFIYDVAMSDIKFG